MGGMVFSANCTSTTAPMTWTILPWLLMTEKRRGWVFKSVGREGRGGDLEDFLRDAGLAGLVVFEGEVADQLRGVVLRGLHRDHARAVLGGLGVENQLVEPAVDVEREEVLEDAGGFRFEENLAIVGLGNFAASFATKVGDGRAETVQR